MIFQLLMIIYETNTRLDMKKKKKEKEKTENKIHRLFKQQRKKQRE